MSAMKIRAKAIRDLENKHGRVTPQQLVDAARSKSHPLHNDFEWNSDTAANKYRLDQARAIISSVRAIVEYGHKKISTVAYVRDPKSAPNEQGYVSITRLRTERDAALETILSEVSRVQSILERAQELSFALDLQEEFTEALAAATSLKSRLRRGPTLEMPAEGFAL